MPVLGSGRASINDFQNDRPIAGTINLLLAISDVALVKSIVKAGVKLTAGLTVRAFAREGAVEIASVGGRALDREAIQLGPKVAVDFAETGNLDGKLYGEAKLAKLKDYLQRRGVALRLEMNSFLLERQGDSYTVALKVQPLF